MINKKEFWENKILNWENKRYSINSPIKNRAINTLNILSKVFNEDSDFCIVELGCGSGIFAEYLIRKFPKLKYYGFDISEKAINQANSKNIKNSQFSSLEINKIEDFLVKNNIKPNYVISLGLFDWLSNEERESLKKIKTDFYLHSFSADNELISILHSIYVFLLYGFKTKSYVPRYDSEKNIYKFWGNGVKIYRNKNMNIAGIATNIKYE